MKESNDIDEEYCHRCNERDEDEIIMRCSPFDDKGCGQLFHISCLTEDMICIDCYKNIDEGDNDIDRDDSEYDPNE